VLTDKRMCLPKSSIIRSFTRREADVHSDEQETLFCYGTKTKENIRHHYQKIPSFRPNQITSIQFTYLQRV